MPISVKELIEFGSDAVDSLNLDRMYKIDRIYMLILKNLVHPVPKKPFALFWGNQDRQSDPAATWGRARLRDNLCRVFS